VVQPSLDTPEFGDAAEERSPFQGLGFYTEADAKWFFGRLTERKVILAHLRTSRLTLLYAESGVGKSSLLRAGVAARLRELAARGVEVSRSPTFIPIVFNAWKDEPVQDLISAIDTHVRAFVPRAAAGTHRQGASSGAAHEGLAAGNDRSEDGSPPTSGGSEAGLAAVITTAASALDATLVIILDQFEEHFAYRLADARPDRFADELAECINSPDVRANFLIAVREDAYGGLGDLFSGRISDIYHNYLHLEYLTRDAARDAIEKPVAMYNAEHPDDEAITLDPDLTDAVLDEVRRGNLELGARRPDRDAGAISLGSNADEIETPFLQLVMTRLWECERGRGSRVLRRTTLEGELGGAETIVRSHVGRALAGLAGDELETAIDLFRDLITPSGVKLAHTAGDLAQMTGHPHDTVVSVLSRLYEERILRAVDPAPGSTQARYEIFHDRLADPILDWRAEQQNARLERAKQSADREAQTQRMQARRFKRRARVTLGLAVSLLILLVAVVVLLQYARDKSDSASREKRAALTDASAARYLEGLTTRAQSQLSGRPVISLLLYLASYGESPQPVAERSLVATLNEVTRSGAVGILHGDTDAVESIAFSPDGTTLASASGDKTIRLWSVTRRGHYPLGRPLRANGPLYSAAFAPDGQTLASGTFGNVILWSIPRHAQQGTIRYDGGAVTSVAYSRHGNELAAGGSKGTVLLWNTVTHRRTFVPVPVGPVRSVAFSPSGNVLAISTLGGVIRWDVAGHRRLGSLTGQPGFVYSVAFSPDGQTVAAAGSKGTIDLWHLANHGQRPTRLAGRLPINSIAFSPNGQTLADAGVGPPVLWNLATHRRLPGPLTGDQGAVFSLAFSPNGSMLASAGADGTISLWNYPVAQRFGIPLVRHRALVDSVAWSPDGRVIASGDQDGQIFLSDRGTGGLLRVIRTNAGQIGDLVFNPTGGVLAAACADGTIRLWDAATGRSLGAPLRRHVGPVYSIAFDRTGTRLVSGGSDGTVRLWDVQSHAELGQPMTGTFGAVYAVAFSPDGLTVASGGSDRAIRLWDAGTQTPLHSPPIAEDDSVFSLAFSPDGRLLASGGADETIHLWRIDTHPYVSIHILTGDSNYIRSVAFSPDGETLASGSADNTVRLWDVGTGTELGSPLIGHTRSAESVAFSRDGQFLASGGDTTVRLWRAIKLPPSFADLRAEVCSFLGAGLSTVEWSRYAPDLPYHRTCPRTTPS
jgi:WD40 repeat protein